MGKERGGCHHDRLFGQSPAERAAEYAALFAAAGFRFIGFTPSAVGTGVFAGVAA